MKLLRHKLLWQSKQTYCQINIRVEFDRFANEELRRVKDRNGAQSSYKVIRTHHRNMFEIIPKLEQRKLEVVTKQILALTNALMYFHEPNS